MDTMDDMTKNIEQSGFSTEAQMRDAEAITPTTVHELASVVDALVNRPHDYGTCVYAMSLAAVAAFNYVASKLGVTGFQASCADMDILRRTRRMKHGFLILNANDVLYPQYDLVEKARDFVEKMRKELAPEAKKLLSESDGYAHPNVIAHWERLATLATEQSPSAPKGGEPCVPPDGTNPGTRHVLVHRYKDERSEFTWAGNGWTAQPRQQDGTLWNPPTMAVMGWSYGEPVDAQKGGEQ